MSKYRFPRQIKIESYHKSLRWKRRKNAARKKRPRQESLDAVMRS